MRGEPVRRFLVLLLVFLGVAEVEHLHLDAGREAPLAGGEPLDTLGVGPEEHAGVAAVLFVLPFDDQLEIGDLFLGADDSNGFAGAFDQVALERPRVIGAIDVHEVVLRHGTPTGLGAGNQRPGDGFAGLGLGERLRLAKRNRGQQGQSDGSCDFHFK